MTLIRHSFLKELFLQLKLKRALTSYLERISLYEFPPLPPINEGIILVATHNSYWDPYLIYLLNKKIFRRRLLNLINEKEYEKFSELHRVSVVKVQSGGLEQLNALTVALNERLNEDHTLISLMATDVVQSPLDRIQIKSNFGSLHSKKRVWIYPLAIFYHPTPNPKYEAFLLFGKRIFLEDYRQNYPLLEEGLNLTINNLQELITKKGVVWNSLL
jgi:hypothetical protein